MVGVGLGTPMRLLRLSASSLVALALVAACNAPSDATSSGVDDYTSTPVDMTLPNVDALRYDVDLTVEGDAGREGYRATVRGNYVATRQLSELTLDFASANDVEQVTVDGVEAEHRGEGDALVITLPKPVSKGARFSSEIRFRGTVFQADGSDPNDFARFGGLMVRQRNAEGQRIFTSLNWPSKAHRWLPVVDHPSDGAQVSFTATWPSSFTVLANGVRLSEEDGEGGTKTWRYEAKTPMPVYDFHVSAYEHWQVDRHLEGGPSETPITSYVYGSSASMAAPIYGDLPKMLAFYEKTFGPYAWGSASFIEEPIFGGGMEHASVVSMDETLFSDAKEARKVAAHELAHHWSGNLVRIRTWNDVWLSEGFAEYLTAKAIGHVDGKAAEKAVFRDYFVRSIQADARLSHAVAPAGDEIDVLSIFDAIIYQKGAFVLRMLEREVGEEAFLSFLHGWFARHAMQAVGTDTLERELEEATGKDLSAFFASFVRSPSHPEVAVRIEGRELVIEQVQRSGPADGFRFSLEVDVDDVRGEAQRVIVPLTGKTTRHGLSFEPNRGARVVVDPDAVALVVAACDATVTCAREDRCRASAGGVSLCLP